jgi:GT2 family glycosyltransferase
MLEENYRYEITASIVMYNNDQQMIMRAVQSILSAKLHIHVYLVDNSETDKLRKLFQENKNITYLFNNANVGFGAGHNIAIKKAMPFTKYHLVINPDIYFEENVLEAMYSYIEKHDDIGMLCPKVYYPDGKLQYLCRKLPTPLDILLKRMPSSLIHLFFQKRIDKYEFKNKNYNQIMDVPSLSGCFMFIRCDVFKKVGFFDENLFMYMEDFDFTRRTARYYRTVYYPNVFIYHHYARESAVNKKLLMIAIKSTIYYFNKWGWIIDKERKKMNTDV